MRLWTRKHWIHDRSSYGALVFLALLSDRRMLLAFSALLGTVVMWNLVASASVATMLDWRWQLSGNSGLVGSLALCVLTLVSVALVCSERADAPSVLGESAARDGLEPAPEAASAIVSTAST